MREIHRLLYYLVYAYDGELINDQNEAKRALKEHNPTIDEASFEDLPDIYQVCSDTNFNVNGTRLINYQIFYLLDYCWLENVYRSFTRAQWMASRLVFPL